MHRDHYTQAIEVRRLVGTPVALGAEERHSIERLLSPDFRPLGAQLTMLAAAGAAALAEQLAELATLDVTGDGAGTEVRGAELGAPGHPALKPASTFGAALGYARPDEWIAAGAGLRSRHPQADCHPDARPHARSRRVRRRRGGPAVRRRSRAAAHHAVDRVRGGTSGSCRCGDYLQSLSVVRELPDMRLLPAHGPVSPSTHARVDELAGHHADRLQAMADVLSGGEHTASEVAQAIGWTSRQPKLADLDVMNQMLAIGETGYHLDLLVARSAAVCRADGDGIRYYRLAPSAEEASQ